MNNPLVSIIVPIYNAEQFLDDCIQSLLHQKYQNLEIILINDGSNDNSLKLCEKYQIQDKRIIIIDQLNKGLSGSRNIGTNVSTGKYIIYHDADDWLDLNTVQESVLLAEKHDYDCILWQFKKIYIDKSILNVGIFGKDTSFIDDDLKSLHRRIAGPIGIETKTPNLIDTFISAWGKLYKRDIILKNKLQFLDTKKVGSEDIPFNFSYFYYCKSAFYIHKPFTFYRKNNINSLTNSHGSTLFPRFLILFENLRYLITSYELNNSFITALNNRIAISVINIGLSETSPKYKRSIIDQIAAINKCITNPLYVQAYQNFNLKYLPVHWKIFYLFCKIKFTLGVYFMLKIMRIFIVK